MKFLLRLAAIVALTGIGRSMTLAEAAAQLGSADPAEATEAEKTLIRGGWDSLGELERLIFSDVRRAAERASRCRLWIRFGVHHGIPEELRKELLDYRKLDDDQRRQLIDRLVKEPSVGPVTFACLHSRVTEENVGDAALKVIETGYEKKQRMIPSDFNQYDPRLLLVTTRAMVANTIAPYKVERGLDDYRRWREMDPSIRTLLNRAGVVWEYTHLKKQDDLMAALAWLPEILDKQGRERAVTDVLRWSRSQIKELSDVPDGSMQGVLMITLEDKDLEQARATYRTLREPHPALAKELSPDLRHFEVDWLIKEERIREAFDLARRSAADEEQPGTLMQEVGNGTREHPELWPDGLPDPARLSPELRAGFLRGYMSDATRRDEGTWWQAVDRYHELLDRSPNPETWIIAAEEAKIPGLFVPYLASSGELDRVFAILRQWSSGYFTTAIGRVLRKDPALAARVPLADLHPGMLRVLLEEMWVWSDSGINEIRNVERLAREWEKQVPNLLTESTNRRLIPVLAIRLWDAGKREECLAKVAGSDLRDFGARFTAQLLDTLTPEEALELAKAAPLPAGTVRECFALVASPGDEKSRKRRSRMLELLGREPELMDARDWVSDHHTREFALNLWMDGDDEAALRVIESAYWITRREYPKQLCILAEILVLGRSPEELLKKTTEHKDRPLHRAILLRALGRDEEALEVLEADRDSPFLPTLLLEQGRYRDAVQAAQRSRPMKRENSESLDARIDSAEFARILELDHDGKRAEAFEICERRSPPAWVRLLAGYRLDEMAREDNFEFFSSLAEDLGRGPAALGTLEARAVAAAGGEAAIGDQEFKSYLRLALYAPNRDRTRGILTRWAELPPSEVESMMRGGFMIHEPLVRTLAELEMTEQAVNYLNAYFELGEAKTPAKARAPGRFCGWYLGENWKEHPVLKLIALEEPGRTLTEHTVSLARLRPRDVRTEDVDRLVALLGKHRASLTDEDVRSVLSAWCHRLAKTDFPEGSTFDASIARFRETVTRRLIHGARTEPLRITFDPAPGNKSDPRAEDFEPIDGVKRVHETWESGKQDEARVLLRDILMRVLLDRNLPEKDMRVHFFYDFSTTGSGGDRSGNEQIILGIGRWKLPHELIGGTCKALARTLDYEDSQYLTFLEFAGKPGLALNLHRNRCVLALCQDMRVDAPRAATAYRRLELRDAIQRGDRDEVLTGVRKFMMVDPFSLNIPLEARAWCVGLDDREGAADVDRSVTRFWEDRLLLAPEFTPYRDALNRWRALTAEQDGD
ncbi:hypothetical protein HAHE_10920 [Haloferula helveola]|uniref:Uncharacterized protein n=1 Tax=Haloferula helveola TaxID=490095 RepID=A0ABN6H440_9BACT|nr:hypothetical protein HAHE_10920 [Haloferula helveola]